MIKMPKGTAEIVGGLDEEQLDYLIDMCNMRKSMLGKLRFDANIDLKITVTDSSGEYTAKICYGGLHIFPSCKYEAQEARIKGLMVKQMESAIAAIKPTLPSPVHEEWTRPSYPGPIPVFARDLICCSGEVDGPMEAYCTEGGWTPLRVGDTLVRDVDAAGNIRIYVK